MKIFLFVLTGVLALVINNAISQNLIAVQNGGTTSFYSSLDSAVNNAQNGDTIYIPGGNYTINDTINKRIHLVGSGIHPDSANVTSMTLISGYSQIILDSGADNGSVTGIYFLYPMGDGYPNIRLINTVTGYSISRCFI